MALIGIRWPLFAPWDLMRKRVRQVQKLCPILCPPWIENKSRCWWQGKGLQVAKRRVGRYPKAFRQMAVERLKSCENIVALAQELGVHRRLLYKWRDQLEPPTR